MNEYILRKLSKGHEGREYTFPLGVNAENVETDDN